MQIVPFPVKPCLQVQVKEPLVLAQSALSSHGSEVTHSSISNEEQQVLDLP